MKMNIIKPTFLINKNICLKNLRKMKKKADDNNLIFRPHFKTHQSFEIGELFKKVGINKISVSSLEMAEFFMNNGWKDITIAFPINILEIDTINKIAAKINLNLLITEKSSLQYLRFALSNLLIINTL